jgi:transcription elongation GreA/GreB family factor
MSDALPDKPAVRKALEDALQRALDTMVNAARATREGAIHEDSRAEGDKDMRSTEQSYLARGQAMRAEDLAEQLQRLRAEKVAASAPDAPIANGALVLVEVEDGARRALFVSPYGAGMVLRVGGVEITVVTPASPMGQALLGKQAGDDFELAARGALRSFVIEAVA